MKPNLLWQQIATVLFPAAVFLVLWAAAEILRAFA